MTRLGAAVLAVLVLGGCSGSAEPEAASSPSASASAPAATPTPAPPVAPPPNRACYRLTYDDAVAPTSTVQPSSCAKPHTSMTFFTGELDTAVDGRPLAVDSDRVRRQVATECPTRFGSFVGGTLEHRRLSMLRTVWFTPTIEESDRGGHWFRCDVIAVRANESLAPLTGPLAGVLQTEAGRDRYAMCGTSEPGTPDFQRVLCPRSGAPTWRAIATVPFPAGRYPGEGRARSAGEARCADAGRAAAADPLDFSWGYEWPTRQQWNAGQTYGICWAPA